MFCLQWHWGHGGENVGGIYYKDLTSHVKIGISNPSEGAQWAPGAFVLDGKPGRPGHPFSLDHHLRSHRCMCLLLNIVCRDDLSYT